MVPEEPKTLNLISNLFSIETVASNSGQAGLNGVDRTTAFACVLCCNVWIECQMHRSLCSQRQLPLGIPPMLTLALPHIHSQECEIWRVLTTTDRARGFRFLISSVQHSQAVQDLSHSVHGVQRLICISGCSELLHLCMHIEPALWLLHEQSLLSTRKN
uniref:Uncharacterized protein n=1 Tax=Eutreptiella gymnastica TaxID=73025 RepID=A0A7S4G999_9EUGL